MQNRDPCELLIQWIESHRPIYFSCDRLPHHIQLVINFNTFIVYIYTYTCIFTFGTLALSFLGSHACRFTLHIITNMRLSLCFATLFLVPLLLSRVIFTTQIHSPTQCTFLFTASFLFAFIVNSKCFLIVERKCKISWDMGVLNWRECEMLRDFKKMITIKSFIQICMSE